MARVKKLLNMVRGCGIRGRLGCGAASIGYRRRIRKRFVHSRCHPAVTELLSSNKLTMELDARWGTPGCGARQKAVGRHRRLDPPTSTRAIAWTSRHLRIEAPVSLVRTFEPARDSKSLPCGARPNGNPPPSWPGLSRPSTPCFATEKQPRRPAPPTTEDTPLARSACHTNPSIPDSRRE